MTVRELIERYKGFDLPVLLTTRGPNDTSPLREVTVEVTVMYADANHVADEFLDCECDDWWWATGDDHKPEYLVLLLEQHNPIEALGMKKTKIDWKTEGEK